MINLSNIVLPEGDACVVCSDKAILNLDGLDLCNLHFGNESNYLPSEIRAMVAKLTFQASQLIRNYSDQFQQRRNMNGIICKECLKNPFRSGGMIIRKVIPKEGPAHDAGLCKKHYRMLQNQSLSVKTGQLVPIS